MIDRITIRAIRRMLLVALAVDVLYWVLWFAERSWVASNARPAYYEFENAFPLADGWLAVLCILSWVALGRLRPVAVLWLLAAGGAGIYLFGLDVLYDLENGIYADGAGGIVEAGVNLLTLVFAVIALRWTWSHRTGLLNSRAELHRPESKKGPVLSPRVNRA